MAVMPETPLQVADYYILPLHIPALPAYPHSATHHLYLRPHEPKLPDPDTPRSLFLANIPIDATETHFRTLFADQLGGARIERVDFDDAPEQPILATDGSIAAQPTAAPSRPNKRKRRVEPVDSESLQMDLPSTWDRALHKSGATAVAVFVDKSSMQLALKHARRAAKNGDEIVWGKGTDGKVPELGSSRYRAHADLVYPDPTLLQAEVDAYMTTLAASEAARARALARQRQAPDEDGFVTVVRGGRSGPARVEEAQRKALELEERERKKPREAFYRFQVREQRKREAGEVQRGFAEERRRVERMRAARRRGT